MRKSVFVNGEYYHIYNRGTDKRKVFFNGKDYQRFVDSMLLFNDTEPIGHLDRELSVEAKPRREVLVSIVAYCLMPNHFHLLLKQVRDNGISKYLQKLLTGYTMFFNKKYDRSGVLCQGVFKSKHIKDDPYLLHLSRYIHLNPREVCAADFIDEQIINKALGEYQWSSYADYLGTRDDDGLADGKNIVLDMFKNGRGYSDFVLDQLKNNNDDLSRFRLDKR
jgi:Transposase IS200 like.